MAIDGGGVVCLFGLLSSDELLPDTLEFSGVTLASPVFSYSSRFNVVLGGLLKLYGLSLLRCLSLNNVLRNQCFMTLGGKPLCAAMSKICSSPGELLMSKCALKIFSCSSVIRVRARFCEAAAFACGMDRTIRDWRIDNFKCLTV